MRLVGDSVVFVKVGVHDHDVEGVGGSFFCVGGWFGDAGPDAVPMGFPTVSEGCPPLMAEMVAVAEARA